MPTSNIPGPSPDTGSAGSPRPRRRAAKVLAAGLVFVALVALAVWANLYAADHEVIRNVARRFGYPGVFVAAAISGFNLAVPIPVVAFFPFFLEVGLAPVPTVAVIALGMTTGDLLGYLLGRTAREAVRVREDGIVARLEAMRAQHPRLPLLIMFLYAAFAPAPNEILVLPLAFLRYPVAGIFAAVLLGNLIFNALIAAGVVQVFGWI